MEKASEYLTAQTKLASEYLSEAMEKQAARAWKQHIGELSEEGLKRLQSADILNHTREMKGLNKGTEEIVRKLGGTIDRSKSQRALMKSLRQMSNAVLKDGKHKWWQRLLTNLTSRPIYNATRKANRGFVTTLPTGDAKQKLFIGAGDISRKPGFLMKLLDKKGLAADPLKDLRNLKQPDRDYLNAIFARHEADELRNGVRIVNNKKLSQPMFEGGKLRTAKTRVFSHVSPDVLARESANVAIAPKTVKDEISKIRQGTGEVSHMNTFYDPKHFTYGKSGVYNKARARKAEKSYAR